MIASISHVTTNTARQLQVVHVALSDVVMGFHFSWHNYTYVINTVTYERNLNVWRVEYTQKVTDENGVSLWNIPTSCSYSPKQVNEAYAKIVAEYR